MIDSWIAEYNPQNENDVYAAMREIMQEIALGGLSRTDFFDRAAFYGGTALRIFYGLDRYSEDLDFSLLAEDENFSLEPYFAAIKKEFAALGLTVNILEKKKSVTTSIESACLKSETIWKELALVGPVTGLRPESNRTITIKIEIDILPPGNFETEEKLLLRPFSFYVKCFTPSSLFAGKLHALLFRKWKTRVKGRDWYDLEWYIRRGTPLNIPHFLERARETGDWTTDSITKEEILKLISDKIEAVSFEQVKADVIRFISDSGKLSIWEPKYFQDLIQHMKFESDSV